MRTEEFEVFRYEYIIQTITFLSLMITFILLFISLPIALIVFFSYSISLIYLLKKLKAADDKLKKVFYKNY